MNPKISIRALTALVALSFAAAAHADGPPQSNGVISNPTLVQNQSVAKAQAAGVITTFMNQGAQSCDSDGKNCHSVFGTDDTPDYTTLQQSSQSLTGVQAFSFLGNNTDEDGGSSNAVASQLGTLALACGDTSVKKVAGIAVKVTDCLVNANGDAQVTVQVCSAPARSNPITPPANQVDCSNDPTAANYRPPAGYVCRRPACDTEPVGSLDGWSAPQTVSWQASLPTSATEDQKSKNGLGLIFYPALNGGQLASFTADSDNMTAVKIVQSFVNSESKRTAVGLKIAYRHKTQVTKDMMVQGPSSVPNPGANTAQWDSIVKLQANEKIPQFQQQYARNGSECLQQIGSGIASDGKITVCDPNYTNESGIKPGQKTAQVAVEGQDCGTTPQCLNKVVNTTTWTESCSAEVPVATRSCTTKQDYTTEKISYTRTRPQETCHEARSQTDHSCNVSVSPATVLVVPRCTPGQFINKSLANGEFGAPGVDKMESQYYCDTTGGDNGQPILLQVRAYGMDGDCHRGWVPISVDFSRRTHLDQAAALSPDWNGDCQYDVRVDVDVTQPCDPINTSCAANLTFYHLSYTKISPIHTYSCPDGTSPASYRDGHIDSCRTSSGSTVAPLQSWTCQDGYTPASYRDGHIDSCQTPKKSVVGYVPMDFLRPGMDIHYDPPVNTCTDYESKS